MMPHAVVLLHFPVLGKHGERITSAVTNLDIHDLARTSRTYGISRLYVVTPVEDQQRLVSRLLQHWREGYGATYNPDRAEALSIVKVFASLPEVMRDWDEYSGQECLPVLTGAGRQKGLTYRQGRALAENRPLLLLFGTAWGLAPELFSRGWAALQSIRGGTSYNHLPVRAAVAITLDRLFGVGEQDQEFCLGQ